MRISWRYQSQPRFPFTKPLKGSALSFPLRRGLVAERDRSIVEVMMSESGRTPTANPPPWASKERRAASRYACGPAKIARVIVSQRRESRWARVRDISAAGIGLHLPAAVAGGEFILLHLNCRPTAQAFLLAEVAHATPQPDGTWAVGCRFDNLLGDLSAAERTQLCEFFQNASETSPDTSSQDALPAMLAQRLANPFASFLRNVERALRAPGQAGGPMIGRRGQRGESLEDLFDLLLASRGRLALQRRPEDLAEICGRACQAISLFCATRGLRLSVVFPPGLVKARVDAVQMERALAKLFSHAAASSRQGGAIRVTIEDCAQEIRVRVTSNGARTTAELPHPTSGFGSSEDVDIGLALARQIVEMHGGTLTAQGDNWEVHLPGDKEPANPRLLPRPETVLSVGKGRRVLVVDDNADSAACLALLLGFQGYQVQIAPDGTQALALAGSFHPEVILLDLGLPDMDGHEVARRLREQEARPVLLIALTGYSSEQDRHEAKEAGFDHYLVKPADPEVLQELLRPQTP